MEGDFLQLVTDQSPQEHKKNAKGDVLGQCCGGDGEAVIAQVGQYHNKQSQRDGGSDGAADISADLIHEEEGENTSQYRIDDCKEKSNHHFEKTQREHDQDNAQQNHRRKLLQPCRGRHTGEFLQKVVSQIMYQDGDTGAAKPIQKPAEGLVVIGDPGIDLIHQKCQDQHGQNLSAYRNKLTAAEIKKNHLRFRKGNIGQGSEESAQTCRIKGADDHANGVHHKNAQCGNQSVLQSRISAQNIPGQNEYQQKAQEKPEQREIHSGKVQGGGE